MKNKALTERQEARAFIKKKYPVGTVVYDRTISQPMTIRKNSVYEVHIDTIDDYSDETTEDKDMYITFLVKSPGKYSPLYTLASYTKSLVLSKYAK